MAWGDAFSKLEAIVCNLFSVHPKSIKLGQMLLSHDLSCGGVDW